MASRKANDPLLHKKTKQNLTANDGKANSSSSNTLAANQKQQQSKPYTHLNSDQHCLQDPNSFWQLALYRLQLYNGLYMLDRSEQVFLYSLAVLALILTCWYGLAFWHGLIDGWRNATTEETIISE